MPGNSFPTGTWTTTGSHFSLSFSVQVLFWGAGGGGKEEPVFVFLYLPTEDEMVGWHHRSDGNEFE